MVVEPVVVEPVVLEETQSCLTLVVTVEMVLLARSLELQLGTVAVVAVVSTPTTAFTVVFTHLAHPILITTVQKT
jgi:hypothetical protein